MKGVAAVTLLCFALPLSGCERDKASARDSRSESHRVVSLDPANFIPEGLVGEIRTEERALSDGSTALCYVIETKSIPVEHEMGPWCPKTVDDTKGQGGVWFKDGVLHDVDGPFIKNLAGLYEDEEWKLYRDDGTVKVTDSKEAFEAAARPDVDARYENYCVEAPPEYVVARNTTYVIPVTPKPLDSPLPLRGVVGISLNGVKFDPPAPVEHIVGAHTIAPLDDGGGHINPHAGYHYHAVTGLSKKVAQSDGHPPLVGYALDGYGLYGALEKGEDDTDECGGHTDDVRGYHYHVGRAGDNRIIKMFRGVPGSATVEGEREEPGHGHPHPPASERGRRSAHKGQR